MVRNNREAFFEINDILNEYGNTQFTKAIEVSATGNIGSITKNINALDINLLSVFSIIEDLTNSSAELSKDSDTQEDLSSD